MKLIRFLILSLIIAFSSCVTITAMASAGATSEATRATTAAMFQNGPQHLGVYDCNPKGTLIGLKWRFQTGGAVYSSPIVTGGICLIGSGDGNLYALDAATGGIVWKYKTAGAVHSSPAVVGNSVFVVSMDGRLHAVGLRDGQPLWQFATKGEKAFDEWDAFLSSPTVDVVIGAGDGTGGTEGSTAGGSVVYFGSSDGNLYAIDAANGAERWHYETAGIIHSSPAVDSTGVYFGNCEGKAFALDKATGAFKWSYKTKGYSDIPNGEIVGSPSVCDGVVYIGSKDHTIYALESSSGKLIWKHQSYPGWVISAPAVRDGQVYFGRTGDYRLCVRDAKTGKNAWTYKTGYFVFGSPALAGQTAFIGSFNGMLYAVDTSTGKLKWRYMTRGCEDNFANYLTKTGEFNSKVYDKLNSLPKGVTSFEFLSGAGAILSSPWVSSNTVYFGSADGSIYALEIE